MEQFSVFYLIHPIVSSKKAMNSRLRPSHGSYQEEPSSLYPRKGGKD